jgi:hypothetical protein
MTRLRRPDGSGGPLSEDERIDDIQFYVDPTAELIIDDIVLYDAAGPDETEPFPSRIVFTGWFDTGQQGKEWPGDFQIVAHEKPLKWKAARSVDGKLNVSLRGARPAKDLHARFRYRLVGATSFSVSAGSAPAVRIESKGEGWAEARLALPAGAPEVDRVGFTVPAGGVLWLDDLLLVDGGR